MASLLTQNTLRRSTSTSTIVPTITHQQTRQASLLRRPIRPYTFTQLITLSDGSTYTQRTTSPQSHYKSTKDTRNNILWQPTMSSLRNIEEDEAGRLRAFRLKFGRGWDIEDANVNAAPTSGTAAKQVSGKGEASEDAAETEDSLMDLISAGYDPSKHQNLGGMSLAESKRLAKAAAKKKK